MNAAFSLDQFADCEQSDSIGKLICVGPLMPAFF